MPLVPDMLPARLRPLVELSECAPHQAIDQAHALFHQTNPADVICAAWACYTLGWACVRAERLPAATHWLAQAQASATLHTQPLLVLHCRRALLLVAALRGAGADLQADWSLLVDEYAAAGHALEAARTRVQQIEHLNSLVQPHAAAALLETVAPLLEAQGTPGDWAFVQRARSSIASDRGDMEAALVQLTQAADLFRTVPSPLEVARCQRLRGWLFQRLEQFDQALAEVQQALLFFEQQGLPLQQALCQRNAANIACYRGEYARALSCAHQARATMAALGRRRAVADCDLTLGNVAYYSRQHDLALLWYRQAQAVYTETGSRYLTLLSQRNQALVLQSQGDAPAAFALLATLDAPMQALGDTSEQAEITLAQALALHDMGDYSRAHDYLERAQQRFAACDNQRGVARALLEQGQVYLAQQQPQQARACVQQAQPMLTDQPMHTWRIYYMLGRCAQMQGTPASALAAYQQASAIVARLRGGLASEHASSGVFSQAQQLFTDALALAAAQHNLAAVVALAEQQRALALQRQVARLDVHLTAETRSHYTRASERLRQLIAADAPAHELDAALSDYTRVLLQVRHSTLDAPALPENLPDLPDLRAQLSAAYPAGWAVLLYTRCGDQLFTLTLTAETLSLEQTPADAELYTLVEQASSGKYAQYTYRDFARLQNPDTPPWQVPTALARRLLPTDLRRRLHPDLRLLIVPVEPLHTLPWALLRLDDAWLCERATIQLLPALALWEALNARRAPGNAALLIGCSQFHGRAPDLPNMQAEHALVAARWPGPSTCLSNAAATRTALLEQAAQGALQRYGLLHITSHARLVAARGLLAHIKLWDSDMLLDEIAQLGLHGALVVLAACDGAASEALPGDEVLSLGHALLSGGARDVVASIWAIFDQATEELLTLLYDELAQGQDVPSALVRAQRGLLARYAHLGDHRAVEYSPVVWGGFLALGAGT